MSGSSSPICDTNPQKQCARRLAIVAVCLAIAYLASGCTSPGILDVDILQDRLDSASPPVNGTHSLAQSFLCQRTNLCEIEILPISYQPTSQGELTLRLRGPEAGGQDLAQWSIDSASIRHNEPLLFHFAPQPDSAGKRYELQIEGTIGAQVGFWFNSVDAYGDGELTLDGASIAGDLVFTTRCYYDLPVMAASVAQALPHAVPLLVPLLLLLVVPGFVLKGSSRAVQPSDPVAQLALCVALSVALIPVVLLWTTVAGLRWKPSAVWVVLGVLAGLALIRVRRHNHVRRNTAGMPWLVPTATGILALTLLARFVQIRNLALPAWVDSPQHVLVTQLIVTQGRVPVSYEPLLPVNLFFYHFGFHALAAVFHWLSGLAVPQAMLVLGQILNAAVALSMYLLTWRLRGRRIAALAAMLIVGLISYMPAYYVSWGRYTQLTGLLLLPAAIVSSMDWLEAPRRDYRLLGVAALLQAGLFLTHARVTLFGVVFLLAYGIVEVFHLRSRGDKAARIEWAARLGLLASLAVIGSGPWLVRVIGTLYAWLRAPGQTLSGDPAYNAWASGLLWIPRNRGLLALAGLGALLGLLRRRRETIIILSWAAFLALLLNPGWLGLAATNLVNNETAIISLFVPLSVLGGEAVVSIWDGAQHAILKLFAHRGQPGQEQLWMRAGLLALAVGTALWGAWGMLSIVNPGTVLATEEDMQAMQWIQKNTPPDAMFLINARHWQGGTYTGTDGGYWIPELTGRHTLLPALPYVYGTLEYVQGVNRAAEIVSDIQGTDDANLRALLKREGVTHIYIGARGGPLRPQMFMPSTLYRLVFNSGGVWIFEVVR